MRSVFQFLGLPDGFGAAVLIVALILLLAPYLSGADLGVFKVPIFSSGAKRRLRIVGPIIFLGTVLLFVPLLPETGRGRSVPGETAIAATLKNLVDLEGGQGPVHHLLRVHCRQRLTEPTFHLPMQAEDVLQRVQEIQAGLKSAHYPENFEVAQFGTYRRLVLDLHKRQQILTSIISNDSIPTEEFCRMASDYQELHFRLARIETDYLRALQSMEEEVNR